MKHGESEYARVVNAYRTGAPVSLTYAEFAEEARQFLIRFVDLFGIETPRFRIDVDYNAEDLTSPDARLGTETGFAQQLFDEEVKTRKTLSRSRKFSFPENFSLDSEERGVSSAQFWFAWPDHESGSSIRISSGSRREGSVKLVLTPTSQARLEQLEALLIGYWSPREVATRVAEDAGLRKRVAYGTGQELPVGTNWSGFFERSWYWNTPEIPNLPKYLSQELILGGRLVISPTANPNDLVRYQAEAIEAGVSIFQNRKHPPTPESRSDIGHDLFQFPIGEVDVDRAGPDDKNLFLVLANSLNRPLSGRELAKLVKVAEQHAHLDKENPVRWLVEGDSIRKQISEAVAHVEKHISVEHL